MDTLSNESIKEKQIAVAFRNGYSPRKLILDRTGDRILNPDFCLYSETDISFYNFIRRDDFISDTFTESNIDDSCYIPVTID